MSMSDEEKAAKIVADKIDEVGSRLGLWIAWATRRVIVAILLAGRLANPWARKGVNIPRMSEADKNEAERMSEDITSFD